MPPAPGETALPTLLRTLTPTLLPTPYLFLSFPPAAPIPPLSPLFTFTEPEGTTVVAPLSTASTFSSSSSASASGTASTASGVKTAFPCAAIRLAVHSSLDAVGLLAAVTAALAAPPHQIPCNAVSAFHHDWLFVPVGRAEEAMGVLRGVAAAASGDGATEEDTAEEAV